MVEIVGLKNPVPIILKPMPIKKNSFGLRARIKLPTIINNPPQNKDFRKPKILSAKIPPINVNA